MHGVLVLGALLLAQGVTCLQIREFRVPAHVAEGSEAVLSCRFDLQGQQLYIVRWLKDDREFYHFKHDSSAAFVTPAPHDFHVRGVSVDPARSGKSWVTLVHLSRDSAGEYACEVVGQAPDYRTTIARKNLTVDLLPVGDPEILGVPKYRKIEQPLELNCTSFGALPVSDVTWFINDEPAARYHLRGPWHRRSASKLGAIDTTTELAFSLRSSHFIHGVMTLKCRATLTPFYEKEVEIRYHLEQPQARRAILEEPTIQFNNKTMMSPLEPPEAADFMFSLRSAVGNGFNSAPEIVTMEVEASPSAPLPVTEPPEAVQHSNRAGLTRSFVDMLILCVPLVAFLLK